MNTTYEWDVEEVDIEGDILDHFHADKLADFPKWICDIIEPEGCQQLVLIRETGDEYHGLCTREWAYVTRNGEGRLQLPTSTDGGHKVPQKYHKELNEWQKDTKK